MDIGIYQSASALSGLQQWQETTAANISSGSIHGYKRRVPTFESVLNKALGPAEAASPADRPEVIRGAEHFDLNPGRVVQTGGEFDFSLGENQFFKVRLPDGGDLYTRNGRFQLNAEGTLVTGRGLPVAVDGNTVTITPANGRVNVSRDGTLHQDAVRLGAFDVVEIHDTAGLIPFLGGFIPDPESGREPKPAAEPGVRQGFLESSNVSPIQEMTQLIRLSRTFEANRKMIQEQDDNMEKAIRYLTPNA